MFDLFAQPPEAPAETAGAGPRALPPVDDGIDIFSKAVVLHLQFRRLGVQRKVSGDDFEITGEGENGQQRADRKMVKASMLILDAPELKAIEKYDGETARFIEGLKSGPAFANQGGFHLIANELKPKIDAWIVEREGPRAALVDDLVNALEKRIAESARRLGPLASKADWPSAATVREAYGVTTRFMTFGYSDAAEAEAWKREALAECRSALRAGFRDVIDHLAERLTPGPDGKPKTFRDSLVANFDDFAAAFEARDLSNDAELAGLVKQARELLRGVSAEDLRRKDGLRTAVAARVAEIKRAVDPLVVADNGGRRYFGD